MRLACALALLLSACLISVTPLAYAGPPDPTWTEGVYDNADGDDIVVSLICVAWFTALFVAAPFAPLDSPRIVSTDLRPTPPSRAPPLSSRPLFSIAASAARRRGGLAFARCDSGARVRDACPPGPGGPLSMTKPSVKSHGFANRTPWSEATREVPSAWLEDEAKKSSSPYSLLSSWKGDRGGVPSHVMIKLLRRRLSENQPDLMKAALPAARLQRAQDMLREIWARAGEASEKDRVWRLVEGVLRLALDRLGTVRVEPDHPGQTRTDRAP